MATMLVQIKIMPKSPETDLEAIKNKSYTIIEEHEGKNIIFREEPIAFGLKAIIIAFDIDEQALLEPLEQALGKIEYVNSVQTIDIRRAFG